MSWTRVKLGELCGLVTKGTTPTSVGLDFSEQGIPFLRVQNISNSNVSLDDALYIDHSAHETLGRSKIRPGDFLITIAGTIGRTAIVPQNFPESNCNQAVAILRIYEDHLWPKFLLHWLSTEDAIGQINGRKVTATISNLSLGQIKELEVPLPPLPEQKRIAAILDKADAIRRKRQQAIQLAGDFIRVVFLDMFGDPVTNSKGWEIRAIDELCLEIVDCVNRTAPTVDYLTPYKMIRTTNVRNYTLDTDNVRHVDAETYKSWVRRLTPRVGDIVFTREAPAGEAAVIRTDEKIFLGQRTMHFRPDQMAVSSDYLLFELMDSGVKSQINKMHAGSTVTHLSVPECKKFKIRVPPLELQKQFESIRSAVLKMREMGAAASDTSLFESVSQKAFSGQL